MLRRYIPALAAIIFFGSCTSLKQLGFTGNKQPASTTASVTPKNEPTSNSKSEIKFLDNISTSAQSTTTEVSSLSEQNKTVQTANFSEPVGLKEVNLPTPLQFKYAMMLGTDADDIQNLELFSFIDEWYGTRYRLGGTTKSGIDCSALMQLLFASIYNLQLPRTSKEQYRFSKRISLTELQEGDLLFYHTRGRGVSHVGVYLSNNKFLHAASSGGVMISDMYDPYFVKRFIGAGRILK
jgi:lipoprotein Spr